MWGNKHLAALGDLRRGVQLSLHGKTHCACEQYEHGRKYRHALTHVAYLGAKGKAQGGRDKQKGQHFKHVACRRGVFMWMGGIDTVKAATVGSQLFWGDLRGLGTHGNKLVCDGCAVFRCQWLQKGCCPVVCKILRNTLLDEQQRHDQRQRQKDIQDRPCGIGPKIAQPDAPRGSHPPDKSKKHGNAHCCGNEILHRQSGHLREIAHGAFSGIGLPVGVGHKADGRIQGQMPTGSGNVPGVQGKQVLRHKQGGQRNQRYGAESDHAGQVAFPAHLFCGVHAHKAVQGALAGGESALQPERFTVHYLAYIFSQRPGQSRQ